MIDRDCDRHAIVLAENSRLIALLELHGIEWRLAPAAAAPSRSAIRMVSALKPRWGAEMDINQKNHDRLLKLIPRLSELKSAASMTAH